MSKVDFKKELKYLYKPSAKKPTMIEVPRMNFIMIDGQGDPNTSEEFAGSVQALYSIAYTIRMLPKKGREPEGYFEYVVPPLEGRWDTIDQQEFDYTDKDNLKWTLMIMQPKFVTRALFEEIQRELIEKKGAEYLGKARFEAFDEGLCAQIMHIGPYDDEPKTLAVLEEYIAEQGYGLIKTGHHEIYLSDPRRSKPENLKTVLRYPITRSE